MCLVLMSEWFDIAMNVVWSVGNISKPKTIIIGSKKNKAMKRKNKNKWLYGNGQFWPNYHDAHFQHPH